MQNFKETFDAMSANQKVSVLNSMSKDELVKTLLALDKAAIEEKKALEQSNQQLLIQNKVQEVKLENSKLVPMFDMKELMASKGLNFYSTSDRKLVNFEATEIARKYNPKFVDFMKEFGYKGERRKYPINLLKDAIAAAAVSKVEYNV